MNTHEEPLNTSSQLHSFSTSWRRRSSKTSAFSVSFFFFSTFDSGLNTGVDALGSGSTRRPIIPRRAAPNINSLSPMAWGGTFAPGDGSVIRQTWSSPPDNATASQWVDLDRIKDFKDDGICAHVDGHGWHHSHFLVIPIVLDVLVVWVLRFSWQKVRVY